MVNVSERNEEEECCLRGEECFRRKYFKLQDNQVYACHVGKHRNYLYVLETVINIVLGDSIRGKTQCLKFTYSSPRGEKSKTRKDRKT